ncbi:MAG: hypothetical protein KDB62_05260 [Solirubrobacterales bacterium]|nr:hypothetical protein [Solirubrobacterales bacterium]
MPVLPEFAEEPDVLSPELLRALAFFPFPVPEPSPPSSDPHPVATHSNNPTAATAASDFR